MANNSLPAPSVCFENVCLSRGGNRILNNICATAPAGGSTVLVGPNGAGKTTLLLCLIGEMAYTGRIQFAGLERQPRMAYVPQHLIMDRSLPLRVCEFLALSRQRLPLWLGLRPWARSEGRQLLQMVKAEHLEQSRMGDLSGGELRRVLLAAALGRNPELLVLDEPAAGVDVRGERLFWELLDGARHERGFTQIMVSHNLPLVAHYATHVVCLNKTVCATGAPRATLTSSTLMELFGVPIHLYPDQCDPEDPGCPQCGVVSEAEGLLPNYAAIERREAARMNARLASRMAASPCEPCGEKAPDQGGSRA
ncbi:MAG TPA: metal ABC transporter ATP-binding protein [Desulfovibrio sp.]|uniref:metal ABC transporter ATP-binding protein n=1 Tax=Desulfovibrio sp. TaxID=885 RepID=UPI002D3FE6A2|nr:metal ABC transporter ATP-binding protein [Desulfovibrio sp.]HZF62282.1 metal ABC transporter ATP-binding protein [Desulfovibrio sp.]